MSNDTPTPRTDALDERLADFDWSEGYGNLLEHARQLERELTAAQAENAELRAKCERLERKRTYWKSIARASTDEWAMEEAESEEPGPEAASEKGATP